MSFSKLKIWTGWWIVRFSLILRGSIDDEYVCTHNVRGVYGLVIAAAALYLRALFRTFWSWARLRSAYRCPPKEMTAYPRLIYFKYKYLGKLIVEEGLKWKDNVDCRHGDFEISDGSQCHYHENELCSGPSVRPTKQDCFLLGREYGGVRGLWTLHGPFGPP